MKLKPKEFMIVLFIVLVMLNGHLVIGLEGRPVWLLVSSEIPKDWNYDSEFEIDGRYYLNFIAPSTAAFSIETLEFENQTLAAAQVTTELRACEEAHTTQSIIYSFPNENVDLSVVDNGYVWEIKSPCCYSRGVVYSVENVYIYIFGSQVSTWSEVKLIYNYQTTKVLHYFGRTVPETLLVENLDTNAASISIVPVLISLITIGAIVSLKKLNQKH